MVMQATTDHGNKRKQRFFLAVIFVVVATFLFSFLSFQEQLDASIAKSAENWLVELLNSYGSVMELEINRKDGPSIEKIQETVSQYRYSVLGQQGCLLLTDNEGGLLLSTYGNNIMPTYRNLFDYLDGVTDLERGSAETVRQDMKLSMSGSIVFSAGGMKVIMAYAPTEGNHFIFSMIPYAAIDQQVAEISKDVYHVLCGLFTAFILVVAYVLYRNKQQVRILHEQQERVRSSEARYKLISQRSNDIIFEYDLLTGYVVYCENFDLLLSPTLQGGDLSHKIVTSGIVQPEDAGKFRDALRLVMSEQRYAETTLRAKGVDDCYRWYQMSLACILDEKGNPWRVVARARDVDKQKREEERLQEKASRDPLTKLLNKMATRKEIDRILSEDTERVHAFLIIDVDDFKKINDTYGHCAGDTVLTRSADGLRGLFRSTDILGRIGGDELVVFCRDIKSLEHARNRADQVCQLFRTLFTPEEKQICTGCSVGIAMAPVDGSSFNQLYVNADLALYTAKEWGKDQYAVYSPSMADIDEAVCTV